MKLHKMRVHIKNHQEILSRIVIEMPILGTTTRMHGHLEGDGTCSTNWDRRLLRHHLRERRILVRENS
ncbi:hypothetical protein DPMN_083714 [Dreissena polymorpha]|uniref:Uncharacterized protein n=1 Tax=Dreissena polymorpha TaxID=45954 RepID=A0A9D4BIQ6_DREPO|nr:hypothetical protein DPMN_083714 [Dreissena polymorpha]